MEPDIEAILGDYEFNPDLVDRIAARKIPHPIEIVDPDPAWPQLFQDFKARILAALGASTVLAILHNGSTSVPNLPAKPVIDIDLTVADITNEASYVPQLEAAGFHFLFREPHWHQHRFFAAYEPYVNLHVWGPGSPEVTRHIIFRERLLSSVEDRELYARVKKEASAETLRTGESVMQYNKRKEKVIREILRRGVQDYLARQ